MLHTSTCSGSLLAVGDDCAVWRCLKLPQNPLSTVFACASLLARSRRCKRQRAAARWCCPMPPRTLSAPCRSAWRRGTTTLCMQPWTRARCLTTMRRCVSAGRVCCAVLRCDLRCICACLPMRGRGCPAVLLRARAAGCWSGPHGVPRRIADRQPLSSLLCLCRAWFTTARSAPATEQPLGHSSGQCLARMPAPRCGVLRAMHDTRRICGTRMHTAPLPLALLLFNPLLLCTIVFFVSTPIPPTPRTCPHFFSPRLELPAEHREPPGCTLPRSAPRNQRPAPELPPLFTNTSWPHPRLLRFSLLLVSV